MKPCWKSWSSGDGGPKGPKIKIAEAVAPAFSDSAIVRLARNSHRAIPVGSLAFYMSFFFALFCVGFEIPASRAVKNLTM